VEEQNKPLTHTCEKKLFQDILKARTAAQFEAVIEDAASVDLCVRPQLVRSHAPPQEQSIPRPGECGGMLTRTEFQIAKFCTEEKLKREHLAASLEGSRRVLLSSKIFVWTLSGILRKQYQTLAAVYFQSIFRARFVERN
jgi:hypothetical protein